jgi:GDP-L-fucose synthase
LIKSIVFPEAKLIFDTNKPDGAPQKLLDVSRIRQMGWKPKIDFRKGIEEVYHWYQKISNSPG